MRNVSDARKALVEQVRMVKSGGCVVCLETSPDPYSILRPLVLFHLKTVIPLLGYWIAQQRGAYKYPQASTLEFMGPEASTDIMIEEGLQDVGYQHFMFGTIAVHWDYKFE